MNKIFFTLLLSVIFLMACSSDKKQERVEDSEAEVSQKQAPQKSGPPEMRELLTQTASGYFEFTLEGKTYRSDDFIPLSSLTYSDGGEGTPRITANIVGKGDPVGASMQFSLNNFRSEGRKKVSGEFPISASGREQFAGFLMSIPEVMSVSQMLNINMENGTANVIELTDQGHIKINFSGKAKYAYIDIETKKAVVKYGEINGSIDLVTELVQSFE